MLNHLKSRHVDFELVRPVVDSENGVATFYLWNLSGQLVGYQQYRRGATKARKNNPKESRYFTYITSGQTAVYGLEFLRPGSATLYVTEGIFDAIRIINLGLNCIAVLGNAGSKDMRNWLSCLPYHLIAICDNDAPGKKLARIADKAIVCQDGKDLGDATEEWITKNILQA